MMQKLQSLLIPVLIGLFLVVAFVLGSTLNEISNTNSKINNLEKRLNKMEEQVNTPKK